MPTSGVPGQQATPSAIRAMPSTRATGMATPASSSPSNNRPTSDGTISNANPVAISPTAARTSTIFIAPSTLIARLGEGLLHLGAFGRRQLLLLRG